ncbi:GPCR, family 2, diuretic hormone receptor,GPCR, family 2, extracellular hormone receptor domain,GPCR [Cinara cedri]|uniref:Diuretic hormone receptor n=1 Tax=Cinara cedri TaxID=506608 RepID=A0A5E4MRA6_9HEMI|nr:GPCR, family 2, diuretic hormone receptor,GPCR, family 2, extracellular hormone receptor domain,GPCR [Cinara cedri]
MNNSTNNNNCPTEKPTNPGWCPNHWDQLMCWKTSKPDVTVFQPCFTELNGLRYDTSQNASRYCKADGVWNSFSDYMKCKALETNEMLPDESILYTSYFYYGGYTISLVALVVAVSIFVYFKDLRCLRNTIHTNLMCSYILSDFTWILTSTLQEWLAVNNNGCLLLTFFLRYFTLTNFFWMFVEGLYLYILVVETFTRENIKLRVYMFIGWGIPLVIIIIWGFANMITSFESEKKEEGTCTWMSTVHEWIYQGPAILVLVVNLIFLSKIMWVLITKLRSANSAETQQYRKASKALLVLIPLLGVTYILTMVGPTEPGTFSNYYSYGRATLLSMQGFMVAIFYCFVNSEVKNTFKHHLVRWNDARNLRTSGSRRFTYSKDWSPNTRSDSVRWSMTRRLPSQV